MKFAIAVVMLAIAGVQSSLVPWPLAVHHGIPVAHSWAHGPVIAAHHGPVLAHHGISLSQGPAWGHHHGIAVAHHAPAHIAVAHHAPAHIAVAHHSPVHHEHAAIIAAPVHHGHEGHYVAKTRGAVHTAPLAGHIASVKSVNVAPAPGTH